MKRAIAAEKALTLIEKKIAEHKKEMGWHLQKNKAEYDKAKKEAGIPLDWD